MNGTVEVPVKSHSHSSYIGDIYVGDDGKLHKKTVGGADTVLNFSSGINKDSILNFDYKGLIYHRNYWSRTENKYLTHNDVSPNPWVVDRDYQALLVASFGGSGGNDATKAQDQGKPFVRTYNDRHILVNTPRETIQLAYIGWGGGGWSSAARFSIMKDIKAEDRVYNIFWVVDLEAL